MASATRHVLGLSGGKDSAALAVYMAQAHPEINTEYFFTDTGQELPEVYEFLGELEGFLGKEIVRLNPDRDFKYWLKRNGNFLPSAQARWCTVSLKIVPFEKWISTMLNEGSKVISYVAIRADENRKGYVPTNPNVETRLPLVEAGIDRAGVVELLEDVGLGLPKYYDWRSRSGCTFCFYQQKIEWVRLMRRHPDAFKEAIELEKTALEDCSPFTWSQGESLTELSKPDRVAQIEKDYEKRLERQKQRRRKNPLLEGLNDISVDDVYGVEESKAICISCHK